MSLDAKTVVDIPKGGQKIPVRDKTYVYYHLGSHKNKNGQNINERVCIGRLDADSGKYGFSNGYFGDNSNRYGMAVIT